MRTEIAIISALALVLSVPVAFGEIVETKGQNYDLVENFFIGEANWQSHPERIMDNGWKNYALSNTGDKIIFNTNAVGSFVFDKNSCSYSIYGNGYNGEQIIPSVSAVATYLNNGQWQNLPINDEACTVTVDRYEDGVFLTSTKVITEDITEDVFIPYTGTTENFYVNATNANFNLIQSSNGTNTGYFNGETRVLESVEVEKFVQEIRLDIFDGFKETFKVWHDGSEELGISQTIHSGESITIGDQTINIAELNGQSFDKQFIIDNEAEILAITDSVNYDFDTGIESLSNVNIIFDGDYKVNMDFSEGNFVGYLEIDPTFTATPTGDGWFRDSDGNNVCSTASSGQSTTVLEPHIYGGGSSYIDCQVAYIEFPVSGFPSSATVTDVALDFYVTSVLTPDACDVRPITTNQPTTSTDQSVFTEIMGGTDYTQLTECQTTGQKSNMSLGNQAVTDFSSSITSGWFALGLKQDTDTVNANKITTIASSSHSTYDPPKLTVTYSFPTVSQPPTGLTTVTGVPVELDWTAPTDNGGSAITGYKVFRTLNEYAQTELPDNSANANGVDFTDNEFLLHGDFITTTEYSNVVYDYSVQTTYEMLVDSTSQYTATMAGVQLINSNNDGKVITDGQWYLKKTGTITGNAFMVVLDSSGTVKGTSTGVDVSTIPTSYTVTDFTFTTPVTLANGDKVVIKYEGSGDGSNHLAFGEHWSTSNPMPSGFEFVVYSKSPAGGGSGNGSWGNDGYPTGLVPYAKFSIQDRDSVSYTIEDKSTNSISVTRPVSNLDEMNDSSIWTQAGTDVGITGGKLVADFNAGSDHRAIKDVGVLSDTFVAHFDFKAVSAPNSPYWTMFAFTDDTTVPRGSNDGVYALIDMGSWNIYLRSSDGSSADYTSQTGSISLSAGNQYYVTYIRDSTTSHSMSVYNDEARTSQVGSTITATNGGTIDGLQYFQTGRVDGGNSGSPVQYEIDNLSISDGTTTHTLEYAGTSTTGVIDTGLQSPNLSYTDTNLPDGTDDFSIGSWVKLDVPQSYDSKVTGISDLLAYYDFEQTGTTLTDQASNLGDGTSNGGVTTGVTGKVGNAWSFDGSNDQIDLPTTTINTDFSVSAWVKDIGGDSGFVLQNNGGYLSSGYFQYYDSGSAYGWRIGHGISPDLNSATYSASSDWQHVVWIQKADGTGEIWVDGSQIISGSSYYASGSATFTIGSRADDTQYSNYSIDELALYTKALSSTEIALLSSAPIIDPNTKLLGLNSISFNVNTDSASVVESVSTNDGYWYFPNPNNNDDDAVDIGTATDWAFLSNDGGSFTISTWFKNDDVWANGNAIMSTTNGGAGAGMIFDVRNNGYLRYVAIGSINNQFNAGLNGDSNWNHLVLKYDDSTSKLELFVNDVSKGSVTQNISGSATPNNPLQLMGTDYTGDTIGGLDNLAIWNVALSSSEITSLYGKADPNGIQTNNLKAFYNFDQTSGDLLDQSTGTASLNRDGTSSGNVDKTNGVTIVNTNSIISATGLTDNTSSPQHYTFTRDGNDWEIYQNGVSEATATDSTSLGTYQSAINIEWNSATANDVIITGADIQPANTATGWNDAQAKSTSYINAGEELSFTIHTTAQGYNTGAGYVCLDSDTTVSSNEADYDYCFYLDDTGAMGVELSGSSSYTGSYSKGDIFSFDISSTGTVSFKKNGSQLTSTTGASTTGNYYAGFLSLYSSTGGAQGMGATLGHPTTPATAYTTNISGMIDEYFIDSTALTSTEIDDIYERGVAPTLLTTVTATEHDDSTAVGGNNYYYSVKATNAIGDSDFLTPFVSGLAGTPADPPSSVSSTINSPNTAPLDITVSWSSPTNVGSGTLTGFEIYRDGVLIDTTGLVTSYPDTVPSGGGTFEYKLKSVSTHGTSGFSSTTSTTTPTVPPTPTSTVSLAIDNPNPSPLDIEVSWTEPASGGSIITGYEVFRSATETGTYTSVGTVTDLDFTDTVPSAGTWYYTFSAVNLVGASGQSPSNSITTASVPSSPLNASSVIPSINSAPYDVTVSWDLPTSTGGSALTGYNVYRQTGSGAFTLVDTTTALGVVNTVPSALNQDYTFKIHSLNNVGESTGFVTTTVTTGNVPDAPVLSFTTGTTALSWTVPSSDASITGYEIFRDGSSLTTITGTSHSDFTSINFGQSYQYEVQAVSSLGNSVDSNSIVTTPETEITGMIVQGVTGTGAVINWNEPAYYQGQITSYSVYYSTPSQSANPTISAGTTTNTYSNFAPTLDYDTSYTFGVTINSPLGNSGFSNLVNATTSVDGSITSADPDTGGVAWFDIDAVNEDSLNVIKFVRETQVIGGNNTDTLQVGYPSWWDSMTCDVDYKFAQKTEQYIEGEDMTAVVNPNDANQQVIGFQFQDIDNEVIEVECAPQQSTQDDGASGKYVMTQNDLTTGLPSIPLVTQINNFSTGEYGTDGDFGALDIVGLFVILISMVGFNRVSPIVGVLISASMIFALSWFGIISIPSVIVGVIALVIFLAWGVNRKR
jgi:hypothetical protein